MTMTNNKKVLYFEGAGWADADTSKATNVENCRIRTAFTNDEGKKIYLEMGAAPIYNKKQIVKYWLYIDFAFYITDDEDDCNNNRIPFNYDDLRENYSYTTEDIKKWINKYLNCSFDTIKTLPDLAGYRVHKSIKTQERYNFGDTFKYDEALTVKRQEIEKHFYNLEKSEGKQFPNFSLWVDENNKNILHLLRHFNGYNKHWTIDISIDNWIDSLQENKLGKYAC